MNTKMSTSTAWFPLVPRPRPPCLPVQTRVENVTATAAQAKAERQPPRDRATLAAAVLNNAALIASDCGIPALARELCGRQYQALAASAPLPGWAARLAMQPVLNVVRQLIRDGDGERAAATLEALHRAALSRTAAVVEDTKVDFGVLTSTAGAHRETCTLTWSALLSDGTRAHALAGRWKEAARLAAAHRGIGTRLLDGRQAAILAYLTGGQPREAAQMTDQSAVTEPWEHAVQAILRVMCQRAAGQDPPTGITTMTAAASALASSETPGATLTRTRIGLIALGLAGDSDATQARDLRTALITAGNADAYAARDLLASHWIAKSLTTAQHSELETLITARGLGAGTIPAQPYERLTTAVNQAESILRYSLCRSC
jgi:hypothetical protein